MVEAGLEKLAESVRALLPAAHSARFPDFTSQLTADQAAEVP